MPKDLMAGENCAIMEGFADGRRMQVPNPFSLQSLDEFFQKFSGGCKKRVMIEGFADRSGLQAPDAGKNLKKTFF